MGNTSHKRRDKRMWAGGLVLLGVLLVISFMVSSRDEKVDPALIAAVEVLEDSAHEKGNLESEIRLIEYSDFQCPACKSAAPAIKALIDTFGDQFVFEYRNFPLRSIHPNAQIAAQAAEAAAMQGKFWEMHDILFENQDQWSESFNPERLFRNYAEEIGINVERFKFDLNSDDIKDRVNTDANEAEALALPGTPAFVFNGEQIDMDTFIKENLDISVVEEITEEV